MIGKQLSHFRIIDKIGEGGMGVVYRAEDQKLGRQVALKVMRPEFVASEDRRQRFIREARSAASVTHPNIVTVHEIDEADGVTFIAMELLQGTGLGAHLSGRAVQADEAVDIAIHIAEGLARAHASGVIHRDLKPDNVIVGSDGHVKILDFGLAKLHDDSGSTAADGDTEVQTVSLNATQDGRILGTAAYMSPEQARGLTVDTRSDVFSFGVLLYEMITGQAPFSGQTITDTLTAILRDRPAPVASLNPNVPAELERILIRCLEKKPEDRYQDTAHLVADLRSLKRLTESNTQPQPLVSLSGDALPSPRSFWQQPRTLAIAAFGLVAILAAAFLMPRFFGPVDAQADQASVAVLPFTNMQDGDDPERFGQILQELIITDLSGLPSMNVYSSQRLFDIQKQLGRVETRTIDRDMASQVAREAGAGTMLTGSVSQLGDRWILTSQLVDVSRGTVVGSERIDGADLYVMVDDLTKRIRANLGRDVDIALAGDLAVRDRTSSSIEAYQTFLEGNELLEDLRFQDAVHAFREAVTVDPDFGQAYYKLAIASWWANGIEGSKMHGDSGEDPVEILSTLLAGDLKLSEKDRMLARAVLPLVERRYEDAKGLYEDLVARHPDAKEAWYGLGEALRHGPGGGPNEATLKAFETAIDLDPGFRLPYYHAVEIYELKQLWERGIDRLESLVSLYPDDMVWRAHHIVLLVGGGEDARAELAIQEALDRAPDVAAQRELLATVADAQFRRAAIDQGVKLIKRGIELDSADVPVRLLAQLATVHRYRQEFDEAETIFKDLLRGEPGNSELVQGLFDVYVEQREFDNARSLILEAIEAKPRAVFYWRWIGLAAQQNDRRTVERAISEGMNATAGHGDMKSGASHLLAAAERGFRDIGDFVQAEEFARRAFDTQPDAKSYGRLGWALLRLGRRDEAAKAFESGVELDANNHESVRGLIRLGLLEGDFVGALESGEMCAKSNPGWGDLALLEAYAAAGRMDEAEAHVDLSVRGIGEATEQLDMLIAVMDVFMRAGHYDRALEHAEAAWATIPDMPFPRLAAMQAWALIRLDRTAEASQLVRSALESSPRYWLLNLLQAELLVSSGDLEGAKRIASDLIDHGPAHARAYTAMATALTQQGRPKEALRYAERRAEMDPGRPGKTLMAWALIAGELDIDKGIRLATEALALPLSHGAAAWDLPHMPSPEHCLGLAYLKKGDATKAVPLLREAAEQRPDRRAIAEHLQQAIAATTSP